MSLDTETVRDAAIGVGIANDPASLSAFLKPGCAAAIWRRRTPAEVHNWLDGLAPDALPRGRAVLVPEMIPQTVTRLCEASGLSEGPERAWLQADIISLADKFRALVPSKYLRLRLDVVTTNACRRFHIDAITARLVCTYRGTGTQYGISTDGTPPSRVFTVQTGAPILLRGTLWPEQPASGLLHRSPPIEGTGETRLVLVVDPIFDLDDAQLG